MVETLRHYFPQRSAILTLIRYLTLHCTISESLTLLTLCDKKDIADIEVTEAL